MDKFERQELKNHAKRVMEKGHYSPGKLMLVHTAVGSGLALLLALVSFLLDQKIAGTSGLGGVGSRAVLQTIQSMLNVAQMVVLVFWSVGLISSFIQINRGQGAAPRDLLAGFRHFGPVLRGKLLHALILAGALVLGGYLGSFVYTLTPMSNGMMEAMEPYYVDGVVDYALLLEDPAFLSAALWSLPVILGCMLVFALPLFYRLRLMDYILMDRPEKGAFYAMRGSKYLMRGKRWDLFKLDLSFWWFYLLELLVILLGCGDIVLQFANVDLGVNQTVAFFVFYVLALVAQLGLYVWKKPLLMTTYAAFYDAAWPQKEEEETAQDYAQAPEELE